MSLLSQLVAVRRERWTQRAVARKMQVSTQQVSNIEHGNPTVSTIERYARAVGVRIVVKVSG